MADLSLSELCGTVPPIGTTSLPCMEAVDGPRADVTNNSANGTNGTGATSVMAEISINEANGANGAGVTSVRADVSPNPGDAGVRGDDVRRADVGGFSDDVSNPGSHRVSVWDRIGIEPKVISQQDGTKKSFASVIGSVPEPELKFFPLEKEGNRRVMIPMELMKGMVRTYKTVLYGYFLGPRIPFPIVLRAVQNAWGKFGFRDAMLNDHGFYFFRFNDEGGCANVVESSPLLIRGAPLFVAPWDPSKGLFKPEHKTCPIWIKFYNIPLVAFNREGISRIASAVGIPLRMDACTATTCDKAWGRTSFAKVLVNVWATGDLPRDVEVVIPRVSGVGEDVVKVVLEYDWEPSQCSICNIFGHKSLDCPKGVSMQPKVTNQVVMDKEGFQQPKRRFWKPKARQVNSGVNQAESSKVVKGNNEQPTDTMVGVGSIKQTDLEAKQTTNEAADTQVKTPALTQVNSMSVQAQSNSMGDNCNKGESLPSNNKQTEKEVTILTKEPNGNNTRDRADQQKVNVADNSSKSVSKPLKSILKNPTNRFSALIDRVIAFDEEPIGTTTSAGRKMDTTLKIGETQRGRRGEDGSNLHPKI